MDDEVLDLPANALLYSVLIPIIIYFLERVRAKRVNWAMAGGEE